MKKTMMWLSMAVALVLVGGFMTDAQACKDCPFPMKVGENQWIMPNGAVRIEIQTAEDPRGPFHNVDVILRDVHTNEILAHGVSRQRKDRKTVNVQMMDFAGKPVQGYLRFLDAKKDHLQVKFTCESCAIGDILD